MRIVLSISLSILLLAASCKDVGTYISFYANQDFIAKVFCVNKENKNSCCEGKCYLTQKLAEGKSENEKPISVTLSDIYQLQYIPIHQLPLLSYNLNKGHKGTFSFLSYLEMEVIDDLFRPPIFI